MNPKTKSILVNICFFFIFWRAFHSRSNYDGFIAEYGNFLKEGIITDFTYKVLTSHFIMCFYLTLSFRKTSQSCFASNRAGKSLARWFPSMTMSIACRWLKSTLIFPQTRSLSKFFLQYFFCVAPFTTFAPPLARLLKRLLIMKHFNERFVLMIDILCHLPQLFALF